MDNFLQTKPHRLDFEWNISDKGLVRITVPKFKTALGNSFCKIMKKDQTFIANLDKLGSVVWKNCNGKFTIQELLDVIKIEFPKEEHIDQRLFLFLQQMKNLKYLDF